MPYRPKDATPATRAANRRAVARYDLDDRQDFADADPNVNIVTPWTPDDRPGAS
jgi:hypothetical protein